MKNKNLFLKIFVAVTYIGMVVVNSLANIIPINGVKTGQISDSYQNLFAPSGLTFSIWSLIYFLLAAYTLYQFGLFQKNKGINKDKLFKKIGIYFSITSITNIFWIFAWHYNFIFISVLLIVNILFFLIKIADILNKEKFSFKENLFIKTPFSVYFGWITVAVIANITTFLVSINWDGFGISNQIWTILILLIGAVIGILRILKDRNIPYGLVLIWAYLGILIKHSSLDKFANRYPNIIVTLIICIVLFSVAEFSILFNKKRL
ncbi:MAG: tryptophan-rich sensory protein [Candidatus Shapirobacteria bacterium]|jgi:hypothetical protein|nr:tryptophan-rich sensory protein [Candidatus Shapirobacteria bacterium]